MAWSETPIFAGKLVARPHGQVASGSNANLDLATAHATYGAVIRGPIVCFNASGVSRTFKIQIVNSGTARTIGRCTTSGSANQLINLLATAYIPGIDDDDPLLILAAGEILRIAPEDTGASAMDFSVLNIASLEYPN